MQSGNPADCTLTDLCNSEEQPSISLLSETELILLKNAYAQHELLRKMYQFHFVYLPNPTGILTTITILSLSFKETNFPQIKLSS